MKELSDKQRKKRDDLVGELREHKAELTKRLKNVNFEIELLNSMIDNYNSTLTAITEFRCEVASVIEDDWSNEEEKWFESDEAEQQQIWKDEWMCEYSDDIEFIEEPTLPDLKHDDELLALPEEP